jgi:hypothetical protein
MGTDREVTEEDLDYADLQEEQLNNFLEDFYDIANEKDILYSKLKKWERIGRP